MEFSSRYLKIFFGLFLLKMGGRGWKTHFWLKKIGGTLFLGGVKKHELGVRNYR